MALFLLVGCFIINLFAGYSQAASGTLTIPGWSSTPNGRVSNDIEIRNREYTFNVYATSNNSSATVSCRFYQHGKSVAHAIATGGSAADSHKSDDFTGLACTWYDIFMAK